MRIVRSLEIVQRISGAGKIVFLATTALLCAGSALSDEQPTRLGTPIKTLVGTCDSGEGWELNQYDNGWFMANGPGGYFIGPNKDVLIAAVCLVKK